MISILLIDANLIIDPPYKAIKSYFLKLFWFFLLILDKLIPVKVRFVICYKEKGLFEFLIIVS